MPLDGVTLIDSPGLCFPLLGVPPPLQAVMGTHQIAQTRDPASGVAYLALHLFLERYYHLRRVDDDEATAADADAIQAWSAYEVCESYAKKKGFFVKHGKGALDVHRAAMALLQEVYDGKLVLYWRPPELNLLRSRQFETEMAPFLSLPVFARE
ncbi:hypothetical protein STCU_12000 [Strigomonas culicis]|uniref:G domain-containing protein n=1 Tax=Strigomonas culicis TaxID=28005 RepID=S9TGJ4_9TRYP|nr:hypothetical protein STCU_12000 [Strigomonas culicis]|eukprot:EPY15473.1 hypothetical protein STCU_12000 [Strigomonas culicis]